MRTHTTLRSRGALISITIVAVALAVALAVAPAAFAASGDITGTVVNGTTAAPAAGTPVTVTFFDAGGKIGASRARTADDGTFAVTPPVAAIGYQVSAVFQGAEFRAPAAQLTASTPAVADLRVYDTTDDPASVVQTDWVVWVDREGSGYAIQQDFGWTNSGDTAYVGTDGVVMTLSLADGARDLQFLGTFLEQRGDVTATEYVSHAPIVPGRSTATIRYTVDAVGRLTLPVTFDTQTFDLFIPSGLTAQAPGLRLAGTTTDTVATGETVTYQQYTAAGLTAATVMNVTLTAAPATTSDGGSATTILLVVAGAALLAGLAFWLLGRRRGSAPPARRARPESRGRRGGASPAPAAPRTAARTPARTTARARLSAAAAAAAAAEADDDDERQLLIDEIAALDLGFERGLLEERTYRRLRVAAKDRLLLAEEAAHEARGTR